VQWRLRWLEHQAQQLSAVASAAPSPACESSHPAQLETPADVCSRSTAVDATYRRALLPSAALARSTAPPCPARTPLTSHRSFQTLAASLDPGFHPCLSRSAHAPLAALQRMQAQATAYYKARTETLTLKSAQLKAVSQSSAQGRRRKTVPGRSSSTSCMDATARRAQRKSSHPDSLIRGSRRSCKPRLRVAGKGLRRRGIVSPSL
jgi:hypothetical protein